VNVSVICGRKICVEDQENIQKKAPADLTDSRRTKSAKFSVSAGEKLLAINYLEAS